MRKIIGLSLFFCVLLFAEVTAQNIDYTEEIIDTLTSEYFGGRGVVDQGERKAADFIKKEFIKFGVKPVEEKYIQSFNYSINTFPGEVKVRLGNNELIPAIDFLVEPKSTKTNGKFELVWYDEKSIPNKTKLKKLAKQHFFDKKIIVVDVVGTEKKEEFELLKMNFVGASGLIFIEEVKLTHHLSTKVVDYLVLKILRDKLDKKAKTISVEVDQKFVPDYQSQNVIGKVEGSKFPDSIIIFSAHYDHLGKMGRNIYFPGANDNASGIAMLLNLAYHYTHKEPPTKTIIFMAFGAEESGILGSKYFTENPTFPLSSINFMINVDIMGTGDEGIQVVNGTEFKPQFNKLVEINKKNDYLKQVKIRGKAANSDHYWFSEKGVPAIFIYTLGGISAYHDIYDVSKTLPLTKFEDCFRLLTDFVSEL